MDKVFEAQEAAEYEAWLESGPGRKYVSASNALLERILDYRPGWRVLDVGCGLGVHLGYLRDRGMLTTGLEAGPVMAKLAGRRLGEKTDISHGDAHDLPYEDNSFDAVIMVNTLELVERRAQALAEAVRVAASRVCVISVNPLSPAYLSRFFLRKGHALHKGRPLYLWSLWRLVRDVLGPVPQTWGGVFPWPKPGAGRRPLGSLIGVCAAVTPRYMTRPLVVEAKRRRRPPAPAHIAGRVSQIERVK